MPPANPWVALDSAADRVAHALNVRRSYDAFRTGELRRGVRAVVAQSWQRSGSAGVDPDQHLAPIVLDERELEHRWRSHPLFPVLPVLRQLLSSATTDARHMLVISDARGVLLWMEGHQEVITATEDMHFVCGADWSEAGAGTNALGTAIAINHPVQIFSAEHFNRRVHPWQCSGAPIHDPETGEILGIIDLTGHLTAAHPHTLALVSAAAGMAEAFLAQELRRRDDQLRAIYLARTAGSRQPSALVTRGGRVLLSVPSDWLAAAPPLPHDGGEVVLDDGTLVAAEPLSGGDAFVLWRRATPRVAAPPALRLELLTTRPRVLLPGQAHELSRRHGEILALLALAPRGLTAEQLALELYGEQGKAVTARAELSRLRRLLGPALEARPYRLVGPVQTDVGDVERLLEQGRLHAAVERYAEPLLPGSDVALVVETRLRLDAALRRAVLETGDPALLRRWCATVSGRDDQPAADRLLALLDTRHHAGDGPRHPLALDLR